MHSASVLIDAGMVDLARPLATVAMPEDWADAPGTVGRPPRGIRVELLDGEDRLVKNPGVTGRIFVDNGLKFAGYSGGGSKPTVGDLMGTGDTGHWDEGGRLFVDDEDFGTRGELEQLCAPGRRR